MRQFSTSSARISLVVPLLVVGLTLWFGFLRLQRIEHIAQLSRGESVPSETSPTGYAGGVRERVLLDHDNLSYEWIAQTQRMLAENTWRIRRVEAENAPAGRETHAASPYRWWLGALAWIDHQATGQPLALSVERTAVYADPLLHLIILLGLALFTARYSGWPGAAIAAFAAAFLFPFAARFFPGVPDPSVLEAACVLGSMLALLIGLQKVEAVDSVSSNDQSRPLDRSGFAWFSLAGVFGGLGMWLSPSSQVPLVVGIFGGGLCVAWIRRQAAPAPESLRLSNAWRVWAVSGAIVVFIAFLVEYLPDHVARWELRGVHPVYGVAWWGVGELLARLTRWIATRRLAAKPRDLIVILFTIAAVLAVPLAMHQTDNRGFLAVHELFFRLTNEPGGAMAPNLVRWIQEEGLSPRVWAALLPVLLIVPAIWLIFRKQTSVEARIAVGVTLGPVLLLGFAAGLHIRQWLLLDAALLALLIASTRAFFVSTTRASVRWIWAGAVGLILLPGFFQLVPAMDPAKDNVMTVSAVVGLVERDLAQWLAKRHDDGLPPLVLAPPRVTTSLIYYGGLRGVGTLSWENSEGLAFAIRTAISTSRDETAALLRQRGVTHVVLPSWDRFFDSYIQQASVQAGELLYPALERWDLPAWLKPIPYQLPSIPGFAGQSVKIFELVDDQSPPLAAARLTEYFLEMGETENARISHQTLLKYPADFSALVARAQLWAALNDAEQFTAVFESLLLRLSAGADRYMSWDRRVALAVVLTQGNQTELAKAQLQRCLAEATEPRLRSLTTASLYRLLVISKSLGLQLLDPALRSRALELLPAASREDV